MEKRCQKCDRMLPLEKFSKNKGCKDGYRNQCKECHNLYYRQYFDNKEKMDKQISRVKRRKNKGRVLFNDYKIEKGCCICGYNKCSQSLQFHHVNGKDDKKFSLYQARVLSLSFEDIKKELEKCVIVCANCHYEIHAGVTKLENPQTLIDSPFTTLNLETSELKDHSDAKRDN